MAAAPLLLLLCLVAARAAHGQQPDALSFISIDCGIPEGAAYADQSTRGLRYVSDAGFTDAGLNAGVNPPYNIEGLNNRYLTARYFPGGARNCYTLRPVAPEDRYLVRATPSTTATTTGSTGSPPSTSTSVSTAGSPSTSPPPAPPTSSRRWRWRWHRRTSCRCAW